MISSEDDDTDVEEITETRVVRPKRSTAGQGIDCLEVNFDKKSYVSRRQVQFLMKQIEKCMDESKSYASRAVGVLFTQMTAKEGIKSMVSSLLLP